MTADEIAHCLARNLFKSDLVVVDRCCWPGAECDLLVVTPKLQVIDVEVKISRSDLKADRNKSKWFRQPEGWYARQERPAPTPLEWPRNVWKHYYAMPAKLWKPELAEFIHPTSGIITVDFAHEDAGEKRHEQQSARSPEHWHHKVVKRAKPCRTYEPIGPKALRKIAYLASFRMWRAYADLHRAHADHRKQLATMSMQGAA